MVLGGEGKFTISGDTLTVCGELGPEDEKSYSEILFKLMESGGEYLSIDLTGLHYMSSAYVGSTCLLTPVAKQRKKSVVVVANQRVGEILRAVGLDKLATLRVTSD